MAYLKLTIIMKSPLPKTASGAVAETIKAHEALREACAAMAKVWCYPEVAKVEQYADDAEPAPAPVRRGRKPRAALGSSPLPATGFAPHRNSSAGAPQAGQPQQISTTGADGEDLLHIPKNMRVRS